MPSSKRAPSTAFCGYDDDCRSFSHSLALPSISESAGARHSTMQIFVMVSMTNKLLTVDVEPTDTFHVLWQKIQDRSGFVSSLLCRVRQPRAPSNWHTPSYRFGSFGAATVSLLIRSASSSKVASCCLIECWPTTPSPRKPPSTSPCDCTEIDSPQSCSLSRWYRPVHRDARWMMDLNACCILMNQHSRIDHPTIQ